MTPQDIEGLHTWFNGYVAGFYSADASGNDHIRLKEKHTLKVCENIVHIARGLELPAQDIRLAEAMGLLHDIGRFKQYAVYQTFNDSASENHARLGLRETRRMRVLAGFEKNSRYLITKAIALHNVSALPPGLSRRTLLFARLLRDADKLDIWRVFSEYFQDSARQADPRSRQAIIMGVPDRPTCSQPILDAFDRKKSAAVQHIVTLNDYKLMLVSWVFDLNFAPTVQLLRRRRLIEKISETLPPLPEVRAALDTAARHLSQHI